MTGRGGFHWWLHDMERKIARLCAGRRCCSCWGGVGINYSFGVSELLDQVEQDGYMIHSLNNKFYLSIHLEVSLFFNHLIIYYIMLFSKLDILIIRHFLLLLCSSSLMFLIVY